MKKALSSNIFLNLAKNRDHEEEAGASDDSIELQSYPTSRFSSSSPTDDDEEHNSDSTTEISKEDSDAGLREQVEDEFVMDSGTALHVASRYIGEDPDIEHAPSMHLSVDHFRTPSGIQRIAHHINKRRKWYITSAWLGYLCLMITIVALILLAIVLRSEPSSNPADVFKPVSWNMNISGSSIPFLYSIQITIEADSCYKFSTNRDPISCAAYKQFEQPLDVYVRQDPSSPHMFINFTDWFSISTLTLVNKTFPPTLRNPVVSVDLGVIGIILRTANDSVQGKPNAFAEIVLPATTALPPDLIVTTEHNGDINVTLRDLTLGQVFVYDNNSMPNGITFSNITASNITVLSNLGSFQGTKILLVAPPWVGNSVATPMATDYVNATEQPVLCNTEGIGNIAVNVGGSILLSDVLQYRTGSIDAVSTGRSSDTSVVIGLNSMGFSGNFTLQGGGTDVFVEGYSIIYDSGNYKEGQIGLGCQSISARSYGNGRVILSRPKLQRDKLIASFVGGNLFTSTTLGRLDKLASSCGGHETPDYILQWTSPGAAYFSFDMDGSAFDGTIYIIDQNSGQEIACGWRWPIGANLNIGQTVLIIIDGAVSSSKGGPFYLSIRRAQYSSLAIMTELLQRLVAVQDNTVGPTEFFNYQHQTLLTELYGTSTITFLSSYRISSPSFNPPIWLADGVVKAVWADFPNGTASLTFWRGYDATDVRNRFEKTQLAFFLPIPYGKVPMWQGASLTSIATLAIIAKQPGALNLLYGLRYSAFYPTDYILIASASPAIIDPYLPSSWLQGLNTSVLGAGFNFNLHVTLNPGTALDLWLYFLGNQYGFSINGSTIQGNIPAPSQNDPFLTPSRFSYGLPLYDTSSPSLPPANRLGIDVIDPFTDSATFSGSWNGDSENLAFGVLDWVIIPSFTSLRSGVIQNSVTPMPTNSSLSFVIDVDVSLSSNASDPQYATSTGPNDLAPSTNATRALVSITKDTVGTLWSIATLPTSLGGGPLSFRNLKNLFNFVLRQAADPLPSFLQQELCIDPTPTIDTITASKAGVNQGTPIDTTIIASFTSTNGIQLLPAEGLTVCLTAPFVVNATAASALCPNSTTNGIVGLQIARTFDGAFVWDPVAGTTKQVPMCIIPTLGLTPWLGGSNYPFASYQLRIGLPSFEAADPRFNFRWNWMLFDVPASDAMPSTLINVITNLFLQPVFSDGRSFDADDSFLLHGSYYPTQKIYSLHGGIPSSSSEIWHPLGIPWIDATQVNLTVVVENPWATSPSIAPTSYPTRIVSLSFTALLSIPFLGVQNRPLTGQLLGLSSMIFRSPSFLSTPSSTRAIDLLLPFMAVQQSLGGKPSHWLSGVYLRAGTAIDVSLTIGPIENANFQQDSAGLNYMGGFTLSFIGHLDIPALTTALPGIASLNLSMSVVVPLTRTTVPWSSQLTTTHAVLEDALLMFYMPAQPQPVLYSYPPLTLH